MMRIASTVVVALAISAMPALAQTTKPDVSDAPSAQNSGAGVPGLPGNKSGPAVKSGTVGSGTEQHNPTVKQQDPSNIKGLPGNKSGPPAKSPSK